MLNFRGVLKEILIDVMLSFGRGACSLLKLRENQNFEKTSSTTKNQFCWILRERVFFKKTSTIQQQERRKSRVDKLQILGTRVELYMTNVKENPNSAFSLKPCSGVTSHCAFFNTTSVRGSKIKNRKNNRFFFQNP